MKKTKTIQMTVLYTTDPNDFCYCFDTYFKTCPMKASGNLDCRNSMVTMSPVEEEVSLARDSVRSISEALSDLEHQIRAVGSGFRIK